jgi:hypothetical protein
MPSLLFATSLEAHLVEVPDDARSQAGLVDLLQKAGLFDFVADLLEFAGVEPATAATGAFVNLDAALGAEEAAFQLDPVAAGAASFALDIDIDGGVLADVEEELAGGFLGLIDFLQFEGIEPDAAAAALANVDGDGSDGDGR